MDEWKYLKVLFSKSCVERRDGDIIRLRMEVDSHKPETIGALQEQMGLAAFQHPKPAHEHPRKHPIRVVVADLGNQRAIEASVISQRRP